MTEYIGHSYQQSPDPVEAVRPITPPQAEDVGYVAVGRASVPQVDPYDRVNPYNPNATTPYDLGALQQLQPPKIASNVSASERPPLRPVDTTYGWEEGHPAVPLVK